MKKIFSFVATALTLFIVFSVYINTVKADPLDYGVDYPWIWEWDEHFCSYDTDAAGPRVSFQYLERVPSVMGVCEDLLDIDGEKGPVSNVGSHGRWAVLKNNPPTAWNAYKDNMHIATSASSTAFLSDGSPWEIHFLFVNWSGGRDGIYFDTKGDDSISTTSLPGLRIGFDEDEDTPGMQGDVYARIGLDDGTELEAVATNGVPYADFFVMKVAYDGADTLSVEIKNRYKQITGSGTATLLPGQSINSDVPAYPLSIGRGDNIWEGAWNGAFRYLGIFDELLDSEKSAFMVDAIYASAFR